MNNNAMQLNTFTDSNGELWIKADDVIAVVETNSALFAHKLSTRKIAAHLSLFAKNLRNL